MVDTRERDQRDRVSDGNQLADDVLKRTQIYLSVFLLSPDAAQNIVLISFVYPFSVRASILAILPISQR